MVRGWRAAGDRVARGGARLLLVTTVVLGVPGWPATAALLHVGGDMMSRAALDTPLSDEVLAGRVFVFVAPDPPSSMYTPLVRSWNRKPVPKAWVTLSFAPHPHRLTRTAIDTVELEVVDGRMLETVFEQLMRSSAFPVPVGMQVRLDGAVLTVIGLDHGLPNRLRLKFDEDPEGGGYSLVKWEDNRLVHLELPAVGQSIEFPRLRGLLP